MFQHLILFMAPEAAAQATMTSPPAVARPARRLPYGLRWNGRLAVSVLAEAAGFGLLLAGGWFGLVVLQVFLDPM